jgi:hypothetical protein
MSERFFAMWILGSEGLAEHYYPGDNPSLRMGEEVNWILGIYNHMGSLQYVVVRVKLLNSTATAPDELTGTPTSVPPIAEFTRILTENETWSMPFNWRIEAAGPSGPGVVLSRLSINGAHFSGELATAVSGFNYRFVFELWFLDQQTNGLTFSWETGNVRHSVWTQIWFNATATVPA